MKAAELRERIEVTRVEGEKLAAQMTKGDVEAAIAAAVAAVIFGGFYLGEIALQLAELNERIDKLSSADGKLFDVRTHGTEL